MTNIQSIQEEMDDIRYNQRLMLSALRNLLDINNPNGMNDYLIELIDRTKK